jgi:hypothetical protein
MTNIENTQPGQPTMRDLYFQWIEAKRKFNQTEEGTDEDDAALEALAEVETEIQMFEPKTLSDMAWKVIVADDHGDLNATPHQLSLVETAYSIVGLGRTRKE